MIDQKLLAILACPLCNGSLQYEHIASEELICRPCGLAFPVEENIPVMLETEARTLTADERLAEKK